MLQSPNDLDRPKGHSLRDFWTTGTISSLCESLTELGDVVIELRDERGLVLDSSAATHQGIVRSIPESASVMPILIADEAIGAVVVYPLKAGSSSKSHEMIKHIGKLIAVTASEMCSDVSLLRYRIKEIGVLYKLSSLLAQGGRVRDMLGLTLELALEVLDLDAGAIMLLPENSAGLVHDELENELRRSASIGLGEYWLNNPVPLTNHILMN